MGTLTSLDEDILVILDDPRDPGVGSEGSPSRDEEILVIPEGSPSGRAAGLRRRVVRSLGLGGATALAALVVIFCIISPAVRESRRGGTLGAQFGHSQVSRKHCDHPEVPVPLSAPGVLRTPDLQVRSPFEPPEKDKH